MSIKVIVSGSGQMGREVLQAVAAEHDMEPVGVVDALSAEEYISLPQGEALIPFERDAATLIARTRPDVVVDFTNAEWTPKLTEAALDSSVRMVIGTSGLNDGFVSRLGEECRKREVGAVLASNFAIGAVLMQQMARLAGKFYKTAEILEQHHNGKADAPSGTSISTARAIAEGHGGPLDVPPTRTETIRGTRGGVVEGVTVHSVRLPGLVAHQEVIFGAPGETLHIRHNTTDRASFMPGVVLAVREVMNLKELVIGLDKLISLDGGAA